MNPAQWQLGDKIGCRPVGDLDCVEAKLGRGGSRSVSLISREPSSVRLAVVVTAGFFRPDFALPAQRRQPAAAVLSLAAISILHTL